MLGIGSRGALAQSMFNHQIPIKLPNGTNGMQPELALVYSPGGGNGIVGMGWQLTGLPAIARVSYGNGIRYAGADSYAHSQLGVLVKQADGSYRSKTESFVKLVPSGTCGDGPCSWTVSYPSGGKAYYGTTTDSRVPVQGRASVRTWGVAKVADLFNNSYEVAYTVDAANGQFYPSLVTYTKAPNLTTYRTVEFAYEARTDTEPGYYQNAFQQTLQRLRWISVKSADRLVRKYRLDYECGAATTACANTTTNRSRLKSVTELGSDGVSALPAQTFTYQDGGSGLRNGPSMPQTAANVTTGDFNGDGKSDFLQVYSNSLQLQYSNGDGTFAPYPIYLIDFTYGASPVLVGDFDGDGVSDVIYNPLGNGSRAHVAFGSPTGGLNPAYATYALPPYTSLSWVLLGDFNGDGMTDLLLPVGSGPLHSIAYVALSNGDGTFRSGGQLYDPAAGFSVLAGDFDGDGQAEILHLGASGNYILYVTGGNQIYVRGPDLGTLPAPEHIAIGDFNGDGKVDLLLTGQYPQQILTSAGDGTFTTGPAIWLGSSGAGELPSILLADFNGDGKTDIFGAWTSCHDDWNGQWVCEGQGAVALSTGDSAFATYDGSYYTPEVASVLDGNGTSRLASGMGDFDGDGKPDFLLWHPTYAQVVFGAGVAPDLLTTVLNGSGGTIGVAYTPAPQVPGAICMSFDTTCDEWGVCTTLRTCGPESQAGNTPVNAAPQQLVTRVTTTDGRGGNYATSYGYSDARLLRGLPQQQRSLGFALMSITDEQTHQSVRTSYLQQPGCEGHIAKVASYGATGLISSEKIYSYLLANPNAGTEVCLEQSQIANTYELGVLGFTQRTDTTSWYNFNPAVKTQYAYRVGASVDNLPTVTVTTQFADDRTNWILGRITDIKTTSGTTTLGEVRNAWSGNTITAKGEWLGGGPDPAVWVTTTMAYDANGNLTTVTAPQTADGRVRTTTTEYDATFHAYPAQVTNAQGQVTLSSYNDAGLIWSLTDLNGNVTTTTYDAFWRKLREARPNGGATDYAYENYGNAAGYPSGQHIRTTTTIDASRSATREEFFDGAGFTFQTVTTGNCPTGVFSEVQRDVAGRPWKTSLPHCELETPAWTTTAYDVMSRVASVTTPDGKATTYGYGTNYRSVTDPNGMKTTRYFNARDKVTSVVDAANQTTRYAYDAVGRLITVTLPNGDVTSQTWDSLNRKTSSIVRLAASRGPLTTTYAYDAVGNLTNVSAAGKTVTFEYDALNRVTLRQPSNETAAGFAYDEDWAANGKGHLTTRIDAGGTTKFGYTNAGQVASYTRSVDASNFSFTYDLVGRVKRMTYPDGSYADYTYTDGGEHGSASLVVNGAVAASATWAGFNAAGKPGSVSFGNIVGTSYGYDVMNHLTSLATTKGSTQLQNLTYDWYTAPNTGGLNIGSISDLRANKIAPDGSNTDEAQSFTYDALYRLTQDVGVWGTKSYTYDAMGNATAFGGVVNRTVAYDDMQAVSGTGFSAGYDDSGNMIHKVLDGTTWDYAWTVDNRLASATKNGILSSQMVYGADGQRVKKIFFPASGPTVTTTYIGNVYEKRAYGDSSPERHTIHLYANGQLVASVTRSGNITTAFNNPTQWRNQWAQMKMYDGASAMGAVMKTGHFIAAVASHPIVVRWVPLAIFGLLSFLLVVAFVRSVSARTLSARFGPRLRFAALPLVLMFAFTACFGRPSGDGLQQKGSQLIVGDTTNGPAIGTYYYHRNHINSSSVVTDASGTEVTRMVYLPFGEVSQPNSWGNETVTSKFTGQEYDAETGLYNYGARYYDPGIGRFVSADSIVPSVTDAQSFNRYTYARDNPIIYTDPTGHSFWSFVSGVFSAIGNAIAAAARGVWHAVKWAANLYVDSLRFWIRGQIFALQIAKSMLIAASKNPMVALGIILAIAAGPPGWVGLAVGIAAQGMAMAAGIRDPQTLALIGAVSGAAAGGLTAMLMSGAKFGAEQALVAAGCPPQLAAACSLLVNLTVNANTDDPQVEGGSEVPEAGPTQDPEITVVDPGGRNGPTYGGTLIVTGSDGEVAVAVPASTWPNPTNASPGIAEGDYEGTYSPTGHHNSVPGVQIEDNGPVETLGPNPNQDGENYADYIHIHAGASVTNRGSAGCPTISPAYADQAWNALEAGHTYPVHIIR